MNEQERKAFEAMEKYCQAEADWYRCSYDENNRLKAGSIRDSIHEFAEIRKDIPKGQNAISYLKTLRDTALSLAADCKITSNAK